MELPEDALLALAADDDAKIRYWTAARSNVPPALRRRLADDPDPEVRAAALSPELWNRLRPAEQEGFRADSHPRISAAVRRVSGGEPPLPCSVPDFRNEADLSRRLRAAAGAAVDRELAQLLVIDGDPRIRAAAAGNSHVPTGIALALVHDPDDDVRLQLSLREDLTEEQRSQMDYTVPPGRREPVRWVTDRHPSAMRAAAASSHVLLRRSVAGAARLPGDVVNSLAHDDDYFVRLTLCEHCDDAPHDLLVEMYRDWRGLSWSSLTSRPNFARAGLARFVDSPLERLRHAALFDPQLTPDLVERLTRDESRMVRTRAVRDPRLPLDRLFALLTEEGPTMTAATNPALTPDLMHLLLDTAGIPGRTS